MKRYAVIDWRSRAVLARAWTRHGACRIADRQAERERYDVVRAA